MTNWTAEFAAWLRTMRAARASLRELDGPGNDVERIARDLGLAPSELRDIAAKGPGGADQLEMRLEGLHLDAAALRREEPLMMRDLERVCTTCGSKRRCVRDWLRFPDDAAWRGYCPNATTLDALENAPPQRQTGTS
ncbi:MAG TPA: hypothetical protein VK456_13630 [Xanthobacteraceae bacterium]|nr:hypothetical protein [Xanthobacteraceae bacterium]